MPRFALQLLVLIALVSCGQKSKVDPLFKAIPLSQSHGDGKYAVFTVKLPLSEESIDVYDSPIDPNSGVGRVPLLGDALRFITQSVFNLGANLGMGRSQITINQPLPDLNSPYLKSLSVKRVFFHIDQKNVLADERPQGLIARLRALIRGGTALDFSFIRELKIRLKMDKGDPTPESYVPEIITEEIENRRRRDDEGVAVVEDEFQPVDLLHYLRKYRSDVLRNSERGSMFVVYSEKPVAVRAFLRRHPELSVLIQELVIVNKSLVIELKGKEMVSEKFFHLLERFEADVETSGITKIDGCDDDTCMDVKVNEQNMLPFLTQGNKLKIETIIDASKVPPQSFRLKGFVEFEVKLDVPL
jgi:hypothetical protein